MLWKWGIACVFIHLFVCFAQAGEYILADYISAALSECINIGFWDSVMKNYLDPVPTERRPVAGTHPWPTKMSNDFKKIFTEGEGFVVGVPFIEFAPNTFWDYGTNSWKGYEIDLLRECVLPLIQEQYEIKEFSFKFRILQQNSFYFFDSVVSRLDGGEAHLMTSISNKKNRQPKVDFSQHHFLSGVNCVRSKYDSGTVIATKSDIDKPNIKIISQSGAITDFMKEEFKNPEVGSSSEDLFKVMLDSPTAHLYCAAIEQVLYWYHAGKHSSSNFTRFESDVIGEFNDILSWALKKDDRSSSSVWWISLLVVPLVCLCCCTICTVCALLCCGSLFVIVFGILLSSVIFCAAFQQKRIRYYGQLQDFDILLEEQKASNRSSKDAKMRIKEELFSIPYESIQLVKEIGRGGSGATVYKAKWQNTTVAFKVFGTGLMNRDQQDLEPFEKELLMMASISNPYILRFYGASLRPPRVGIVMEYCENGSLYSLIDMIQHNRTFMEMNEKIRILKEVTSGMEYLHSNGICHRDLKCDNILLDDFMGCKICDFGTSRFLASKEKNLTVQEDLTSKIGTSIYLAPEVFLGNKYTYSCDIFSFGILTWMVLKENLDPYDRANCKDLEYGIEQMVALKPEFRPKVDDYIHEKDQWIWDIIVACWDHNPKKRPTFAKLVKEFTGKFDVDEGERRKKVMIEEKMDRRGSLRFFGGGGKNASPRMEIEILKKELSEKNQELEKLKKIVKEQNIVID